MSDYHKIIRRARNVETSPKFAPYTAVRILTGLQDENNADIVYEAGNFNTGRVLEIKNEWGTQEQADDIFEEINGFAYQPYEATQAMLNPAAQLGDAVDVNGIYSGIFVKETKFSDMMTSSIAAPMDEELDHELHYESPQDRSYTRMVKNMRATFRIQASQIAAKVEAVSTGEAFGWTLTADQWRLWSGSENSPVLIANRDGLTVTGIVKASSFLNSAGQQMATQEQVSAVMGSYAGGGIGGGTFFNNATVNDTSIYPTYFTCGTLFAKSGISSVGAINTSSNLTVVGNTYARNLYVRDGNNNDIRATWQSKSFSVSVPSDFHVYDAQSVYNQDGIRILSYMNSYIGHGSSSQSIGSIYYLGQ